MKSFAELLTIYIKQAGITDTELARAIGVSRQTIFRWREGITGRPNYREDIIAIAEKLRLKPDERDTLLLAGGFRPDDVDFTDKEPSESISSVERTDEINENTENINIISEGADKREQPSSFGRNKILSRFTGRYLFYIFGVLILLAAGVWLVIGNLPDKESVNNVVSENETENTAEVSTAIVPAAPGEILIIVTLFNTENRGFNVTEQIVTILKRESTNNRIQNIRIEEFTQAANNNQQALQILREKRAVMIIYGEINSSLININIIPVSGQIPDTAVIDFSDRISIESVSLAALGKVCIDNQNIEQAYSFLYKAGNLLNDYSIDNDTVFMIIDEFITEANILSEK